MIRRYGFVLCALLLCASLAQAGPWDKTPRGTMGIDDGPVNARIDVGTTQPSSEDLTADQIDAMVSPTGDGWTHAIGPVATFLELAEPQVAALVQLLVQRQLAVTPLALEIKQREAVLAELFESGEPNPVAVGVLVIQIRALHAAIVGVQVEFLTTFHDLLFPGQQEKLGIVHVAAGLQPILPAFKGLGLI